MAENDPWFRWLTGRRDADSRAQRERSWNALAPIRDRILNAAEPLEGATVLDVGCGDGLIGLEALERTGASGRVLFADISEPLLDTCRQAVLARGLEDRAQFVVSDAASLTGIGDASVDVLTTRSVVLFLADKPGAFRAFFRVLRPGGRVSLFEPINRLTYPEPPGRLWGYDLRAVADLVERVQRAYAALESPATATMLDFDEQDLVGFAEAAGFGAIRLRLEVTIDPGRSLFDALDVDTLLDSAPNPLAPTLREALESALDARERVKLLEHLRMAHAAGAAVRRSAVTYLTARKPEPAGGGT